MCYVDTHKVTDGRGSPTSRWEEMESRSARPRTEEACIDLSEHVRHHIGGKRSELLKTELENKFITKPPAASNTE